MASVAMAATGAAVGGTAAGVWAWRPIAGGRGPSLVCRSSDSEAEGTSLEQVAMPLTAIGPLETTSRDLIRRNRLKAILIEVDEELRLGKELLARGEKVIEQQKLEARKQRSMEDIEAKLAEQERSILGASYNFLTVDGEAIAKVLIYQKMQAEQERNVLNIVKKFAGKVVEAALTPIPKRTVLRKLLNLFPFLRSD